MTKQKNPAVISREYLRQLKRNARGLCFRAACPNIIARSGLCEEHAAKDRKRLKAAYRAKKAKAA
jgi:hypothetical protein